MTIDEILDEVEQSDREATPGPWHRETGDGINEVYDKPDLGLRIADVPWDSCDDVDRAITDASLIAAFRSHAPALAAEVRRLHEALERRVPLTHDTLAQALRNIGHDATCAACMEVFYSGATDGQHTCWRDLRLHAPALTSEEARSLLDDCASPDEIGRRRKRSRERLAALAKGK